MTLWELYDEARKEATANLDAAINEAYILRLEKRIEELESELREVRRLHDEVPF